MGTLTQTNIVDRIVNKTIGRINVHMPEYYEPPQNWQNRGKIEIIFSPFWRNWKVIRSIFPYHVGDKVKFSIHTEHPNTTPDLLNHVVHEIFSGEHNRDFRFDGVDTNIPVSMITRTGDVEYSIARGNSRTNEKPIFSTTVESWDTIRVRWFSLIVAAILGGAISLVVGILLGFIQIAPALIAEW